MATSKTKSEFAKIDYPLLIGGLITMFVAVVAGLEARESSNLEVWGLAVPGMILIAIGASGVTRGKYIEGTIQLAVGVTMNVCAILQPQLFWVITGIVALLLSIALLFFTISAKQKTTKATMKYMAVIFGIASGIMLIIAYVNQIGKLGITYRMIYYIMTGIIVGFFGIFITAASLLVHEK